MEGEATPLPERLVLVVDDEEAVCHLTARVLADAGFHVLEAHSGLEAVALLSSLNASVQLVVSDISMPGMTGVDLAALMAAQWPMTPLLLVSGQGGPAADCPGSFLPKPFTPEALLDAVAGLLAASKH
jgi:CheY-like chemotaxis protein